MKGVLVSTYQEPTSSKGNDDIWYVFVTGSMNFFGSEKITRDNSPACRKHNGDIWIM